MPSIVKKAKEPQEDFMNKFKTFMEGSKKIKKYNEYFRYLEILKKIYFSEEKLDDKYFFPKIEGISR